jgi:hypothetical protein
MNKKLRLAFFSLVLVFGGVHSAHAAIVSVPVNTYNSLYPGVYNTTITNPNIAASRFSIVNAVDYTSGIIPAVTAGTTGLSQEQAQLRVLNNIARLIKSPRARINSHLLAGNIAANQVMMEKFLAWSPVSMQVMQCGNATDLGIALAVSSGFFSWNDFRILSWNNVHTTSEVRINNSYWALADFDTGMPAFMNLKPNGQYASVADIAANPALVQQWGIFNGRPTNLGIDLTSYAQIFSAAPDVISAPTQVAFNQNIDKSTWVLCPGCQISWSHTQAPTFDLHNPPTLALLNQMMANYRCWMMTGDQTCLNNLTAALATQGINNVNIQNLTQAFVFNYGQVQEGVPTTVPTISITIPAANYTRTIGALGDLRVPLLVYKARITGGSATVDGVTINGNYQANLYDTRPYGTPGRTEPQATTQDLITLTSGTIPAGVSARFEVLYNPGAMSFFRGFSLNQTTSGKLNIRVMRPTTTVAADILVPTQ